MKANDSTLFRAGVFLTTERNEEAVGTTPPTIGAATIIAMSEVEKNIKITDAIIIKEKE